MANVTIKNRHPQMVPLSLIEGGEVVEVKLGPYATHGPIPESSLTPQVRNLAGRARISLLPVVPS